MLWRLPFGRGSEPWPLVAADVRERFPLLGPRLDALEELQVERLFHERDRQALSAQRRYRRFQLLVIFGSALTSFFGALQLVTDDPRFAGIAIAVAGFGTSTMARVQRTSGPLTEYVQGRSQAEKLRSLFFRYLCAADRGDPRSLEADIATISYPIDRGRVR